MTIIEDTRQQKGKHKHKYRYFESNGVKVVRSKLLIGDYANIKNMTTIVDTKKDIQEIIGNVTKDHKRFVSECDLAQENGIQLVVLIENTDRVRNLEDLSKWYNWRLKKSPKATTGETLAKILKAMECRHGVQFEFCHPEESGERIIKLLSGNEG